MCPPPDEYDAAPQSRLLEFLTRFDNPFDEYVQPLDPGSGFLKSHVKDINWEVFKRLRAATDRYRVDLSELDAERSAGGLPRSGVVVLLGERGSGKTHMLHALSKTRDDGNVGATIVTPVRYAGETGMAEYLLRQLVRSLQESLDEPENPILELADSFARRVLAQSLYGTNEIEWLAHLAGEAKSVALLRGKQLDTLIGQKYQLAEELESSSQAKLVTLCQKYGLRSEAAWQLARFRIERTEPRRTFRSQIRRRLYSRLVDTGFFQENVVVDRLLAYLLEEYAEVEAQKAPSREDLVEELLRALTELFILIGRPVVFVFDALEILFGDPAEETKCHRFFSDLANLMDGFRGLPMFVFAERGYWQNVQSRFISGYARNRLEQGITTRDHGTLTTLELSRITNNDLERVVEKRMRTLLDEYHHPDPVPLNRSLEPFSQQDIHAMYGDGVQTPTLRNAIQSLRDRYNAIVFRHGQATSSILPAEEVAGQPEEIEHPVQPTGRQPEPQLTKPQPTKPQPSKPQPSKPQPSKPQPSKPQPSKPQPSKPQPSKKVPKGRWDADIKAAKRAIDRGVGQKVDQLLDGTLAWLQYLADADAEADLRGWKAVEAGRRTFGKHPTYGQLITCRWQRGQKTRLSGISFLTATGSGMHKDLEEKLKMISKASRLVEELVIIWPKDGVEFPAHKQLPDATQRVWKEYANDKTNPGIRLKAIKPIALSPWIALESWSRYLRDLDDVDKQGVRELIIEETRDLIQYVIPRD